MSSIESSLLAFVVMASLLTITPGIDTALVLRTAATHGAHAALKTGLGIVMGCLVWAAIVAAGLSELLLASEFAYDTLRWIGAIYLVCLGLKLLRNPRGALSEMGPSRHSNQGRGAFIRGALTNLLNPKVGIFYVTFLPQFVPAHVPVASFTFLLGTIHGLLGLIWFFVLIAVSRPLTKWLRHVSTMQWLDRTTGAIFVAFGIRLAIVSRTR